ncbi:hypothetical protein AB0B81_07030, partial [Streptomyces sp. NPDC039028]
MSTLFDAIRHGDEDGAVRALRDGADPEGREDGESALYRAALGNEAGIVRVLLAGSCFGGVHTPRAGGFPAHSWRVKSNAGVRLP